MLSLTVKIECVDFDGAQKLKRAFLKNTIGYDVHVYSEKHKYYVVITLDGDLP